MIKSPAARLKRRYANNIGIQEQNNEGMRQNSE
jgi:hypothetical protein